MHQWRFRLPRFRRVIGDVMSYNSLTTMQYNLSLQNISLLFNFRNHSSSPKLANTSTYFSTPTTRLTGWARGTSSPPRATSSPSTKGSGPRSGKTSSTLAITTATIFSQSTIHWSVETRLASFRRQTARISSILIRRFSCRWKVDTCHKFFRSLELTHDVTAAVNDILFQGPI